MQTSFPDLPFPFAGAFIPSTFKSVVTCTPRAYPRTDLTTMCSWPSFLDDIDSAIQKAMVHNNISTGTKLTVGPVVRRPQMIRCEEGLRGHAQSELHGAVLDVLARLGIEGEFYIPGGGGVAIVGEPDFSWIQDQGNMQPHPKLAVEYKAWWEADLINLPTSFAKPMRTPSEERSIEGLEQLYGYMSFNENKYSILTNWKRAWAFRRIETADRKTLQYAGPIELDDPASSLSMLKLFVGMVLLAEEEWFYASPIVNIAPPNCFFSLHEDSCSCSKDASREIHCRLISGHISLLKHRFQTL